MSVDGEWFWDPSHVGTKGGASDWGWKLRITGPAGMLRSSCSDQQAPVTGVALDRADNEVMRYEFSSTSPQARSLCIGGVRAWECAPV